MRQPYLTSRLQGFGTTIFAEMSELAARTGSINLGQGFPDADGPSAVLDTAVDAIRAGHNQYPPGQGERGLLDAIAVHQLRFYGISVDSALVTAGATEALTAALIALCEPGDEVIAFEPTYDSYAAAVAMAGATLRVVTLTPPTYALDTDALAAAISPRTRMLLLNTPHNPTGKVFDAGELGAIATLCVERDILAVTDEVYEHLLFDGRRHVPLCTLPGMAERTVTISSGGKTFSCTGWKIGWATGPEALVSAVRTAKQFLTYVNGAPFQPAIAAGLALDDAFFESLRDDLETKRDIVCDGLAAAGFDVFKPAGTYFVTADIRPLGATDGMTFCRELPERCGVVAVPNQVFYTDEARGRHLVRFAFCKQVSVLEEAAARLKSLA